MSMHIFAPFSLFPIHHPWDIGQILICEPGYFRDVFKRFSEITAERGTPLLFDAMPIGSFEGFVSFGENILVSGEDRWLLRRWYLC